jgi:hypothetical protein
MTWRNRKPAADPEMTELADSSSGETVLVPADALRTVADRFLPLLLKYGSVNLTLGTPREQPERPKGLIKGSGRMGEPRKLEHIVSIRADAPLLDAVCRLAAGEGISVSEWMRRAAAREVAEQEKSPAPSVPSGYRVVGWQCTHMTMTSGGIHWGKVTAMCGCEMQPLYEPVAA